MPAAWESAAFTRVITLKLYLVHTQTISLFSSIPLYNFSPSLTIPSPNFTPSTTPNDLITMESTEIIRGSGRFYSMHKILPLNLILQIHRGMGIRSARPVAFSSWLFLRSMISARSKSIVCCKSFLVTHVSGRVLSEFCCILLVMYHSVEEGVG